MIILIFSLFFKKKYLKCNADNQKPGNSKLCAPFNERTLIGLNLVGYSKRGKRAD